MRIERTKNATRNIIFGLILKGYQLVVPFLMRTAMIYLMGVQFVGLNSLFTSVLQVLNLAEMGIGSAMIYSMYKPIAEDDEETICALMRLYRTYYRRIGLIIAFIGCTLTPFVPKLISGDVPGGLNIYVIYLLNLGATVLSYWLFAYKNSILQAHQRVDVVSKVTLVTSTMQYIMQMIVLWAFKNYYMFVIVMLVTQIFTNIITAIVADKIYPNFRAKGELDNKVVHKINRRIKDLFTAKLGGTITNSVDTLVISAFLGLTVLAVYQNYYFVMNSICGIFTVLFSSVTAGIGNSLITESKEKNMGIFSQYTFIICFVLCVCCCCFIGLYQPFIEMWVGTEYMLGFEYVILFCILFYCLELAMIWATVKDAAGIWHSDRFRPLIGALANLIMNLLFVKTIGLYGVILSTILSYVFISMPWLIHNLFTQIYKTSMCSYLKNVVHYIMVTICCGILVYFACSQIKICGFIGLCIKGIESVCIPLILQCIVYRNQKEFIDARTLVVRIIRKE